MIHHQPKKEKKFHDSKTPLLRVILSRIGLGVTQNQEVKSIIDTI